MHVCKGGASQSHSAKPNKPTATTPIKISNPPSTKNFMSLPITTTTISKRQPDHDGQRGVICPWRWLRPLFLSRQSTVPLTATLRYEHSTICVSLSSRTKCTMKAKVMHPDDIVHIRRWSDFSRRSIPWPSKFPA